ncbi:MAG: pyruvate, water dikinase regulatory protein [Thalassobaculales bacterium]
MPHRSAHAPIHLHLVSDATGETIQRVARACMAQFEGVEPVEHVWSLVRTANHVEKVIGGIRAHPGPVLFTLMNGELRRRVEGACRELAVPAIGVLDPVIAAFHGFLGQAARPRTGWTHMLDDAYFQRIEAMNFAILHDDGQNQHELDLADIVLVGVSRTSKTPTSLYLANRGYRTANVPIVPGMPLTPEVLNCRRPLMVGLTNDPDRLVQLRRNRILQLKGETRTDYVDLDAVRAEVQQARRLFGQLGWPVIDVTRRSIEETSATILQHLQNRRGADA